MQDVFLEMHVLTAWALCEAGTWVTAEMCSSLQMLAHPSVQSPGLCRAWAGLIALPVSDCCGLVHQAAAISLVSSPVTKVLLILKGLLIFASCVLEVFICKTCILSLCARFFLCCIPFANHYGCNPPWVKTFRLDQLTNSMVDREATACSWLHFLLLAQDLGEVTNIY